MNEPAIHTTMNAMRQGLEGRDAGILANLYADDATIEIIDRTHPPSRETSP
jgi:hypothetical protein